MPIKLKKTNIQYDIDPPENGYIILGFDENGNLVTKNDQGDYEPIINDVSTGNFVRLEVDYLTVGNRVSGVAEGLYSIAQGLNISASGDTSFAQGNNAIAGGVYSYARGNNVQATGYLSYAAGEGPGTVNKITASGVNTFVHMHSNNPAYIGSSANYSAILGGQNHNIGDNSTSSVIIGGTLNFIGTSVTNSVILGGTSQIAVSNNTVYVPKIVYKLQTSDPSTENGMIFYKNDSHFYGYAGGSKVRLDNSLTLTNNANNRILTATGTEDINGEANLTFNGSTLSVSGNINLNGNDILSANEISCDYISGNPYIGGGYVGSTSLHVVSTSTTTTTPIMDIRNTSSGDANVWFRAGSTDWTIGVDASDGPKFKIYQDDYLSTTTINTVLETFKSTQPGTSSLRNETYMNGWIRLENSVQSGMVLEVKQSNANGDNDPSPLEINRSAVSATWWLTFLRCRGGGVDKGGITVPGSATTPQFFAGTSDIRAKNTINEWEEDALNILNNVPVKTYYYNEDSGSTNLQIGWIAQDVQPYIPHMVLNTTHGPVDDPYLTIMPSSLYPYFHKSIQQLSAKIEALEQRIYNLENPV